MSGRCEYHVDIARDDAAGCMRCSNLLTFSVLWSSFNRNFGRRADEPSAADATKIVWLGKTDETEEVLEPDLRIIDVRSCSSLLCL